MLFRPPAPLLVEAIPAACRAVIARQDVLPLCCRNPAPPDGTKRYETEPAGPDNICENRHLKAKSAYLLKNLKAAESHSTFPSVA